MLQIAQTFKHTLVYSSSTIIAKAVGFIMLPIYAHCLDSEGYGIIGMIDVFLSVFVVFAGYGISGAMERIYFQRTDENSKNQLISTAIILLFFIIAVLCVPSIFFAEQFALLTFGASGMGEFIVLATLTFLGTMTSQNAEVYLQIKKKSFLLAFLSLTRLIIGLSLNIYFIVYKGMGVLGYLYSGLITSWVSTIILHVISFSKTGWHFSLFDAKELIIFILPLIPGVIANLIGNNANRIILRSFLGLSMLGVFEMLFKFVTLIGIIITVPFMKIWSVQRLEIADDKNGPIIIAQMYTIYLSLLLFFGLILSVEIPLLLQILTPPSFWLTGKIIIIAVFSRILAASYYHFWFGLVYAKKTFEISKINMWMVLFNLISAALLIKFFGLLGAIVQGCISNLAKCLLGLHRANKYYKIPFEWLKIIKLIIFAMVMFLAVDSISLSSINGFNQWLSINIAPVLKLILQFSYLDTIKDGKIVIILIEKLPLILDLGVKFIFCLFFLIGLFIYNATLREKMMHLLKNRHSFLHLKKSSSL